MAITTHTAEIPAVDISASPAGDIQVRAARELARDRAAGRAVDRKAERVAATSRGWLLLTADNVADILTAGESVGREYLGSDSAEIATAGLDRVARWIGGLEDNAAVLARLATSRGASGYAARLARLAARQYAAKHGTGRGSMPRLVLSDDELDTRLSDIYGARSHSVAVATAARVDSAEIDQVELGERVAAAQWHAVLRGSPTAYRSISDDELDQVRRVSRFERTAAAPMFSRWLDQYGDTVPTAGTGHTFAHRAPGMPERDAGPIRRGTLGDRLTALGCDAETIRAARLAKSRKMYADLKAAGERIAPSETPENMFRQTDLAKKAGTSQAQISAWERGDKEPELPSLRKLAKALDMPLIELIGE